MMNSNEILTLLPNEAKQFSETMYRVQENTSFSWLVNGTTEELDGWNTLPDVIFSDIMMMVGLESLDTLHSCRQVCQSWNEMIVNKKNISLQF